MTNRSLDKLAEALIAAAPVFKDGDGNLALAVYRTLAEGKPVSDFDLATATELPIEVVESTLASWPGVFRDENNQIVGFWGLALSETPHVLDIRGVRLYAWCAWDTLFLPSVLGTDIVVQSTDPSSGEGVTLKVSPENVTECSHKEMVVSFLAPDTRFDDNVVMNFCHFVHFFTGPESAGPWLAAHDATFLIELDDAFELGQRWNAARGLTGVAE